RLVGTQIGARRHRMGGGGGGDEGLVHGGSKGTQSLRGGAEKLLVTGTERPLPGDPTELCAADADVLGGKFGDLDARREHGEPQRRLAAASQDHVAAGTPALGDVDDVAGTQPIEEGGTPRSPALAFGQVLPDVAQLALGVAPSRLQLAHE